jgi:hypothetical protein
MQGGFQMNRPLKRSTGYLAAAIAGLTIVGMSALASAGTLPLAAAALRTAAPNAIVAVQWDNNPWSFAGQTRSGWDWGWGAAPYAFPQGRQTHVMYYAAAPYYFPNFQTQLGFNGHFGYPAAVQYANPPRYYPPR